MNAEENKPIWIRLPKYGDRCEFTGLSRSTLAELIRPCKSTGENARVEAKTIERSGATRGITLINLKSLLDFINAQPSPKMHTETEEDLNNKKKGTK